MKLLAEVLAKATVCAALWVGIGALFGQSEDYLVTAGVVTFFAYALGFWHGRWT